MIRHARYNVFLAAFSLLAAVALAAPSAWAEPVLRVSGKPTVFKVTVTKVELNNGTSFVTVFSGSAQLDLVAAAAGAAFPGISSLPLPSGTYDLIRITFLNQFGVQGSLPFNGVTWYVTSTAVADTGGTAAQGSADSRQAGEAGLRSSEWGALGASVTQNVTIPRVTIAQGTAYAPTVKFTVTNALQLWEDAGVSHYLTLAPITITVQ